MKIELNNRDGIILAAGLGSRLRNSDSETTIKPLANIESLSLLVRTINSLESANCKRVIIVLGWQAEEIRNQIIKRYNGPVKLEFVYNEQYLLNNGISVLCARSLVSGEFILTMADHILDDKIMSLIRNHEPPKGGATLCVDYKLDTILDIDDATKVRSNGSYVKKIGKGLTEYNCIDTGVFIGTEGLFEAIDQVYKEKGDASLSEGVQLLADNGLMTTLDIKDAFWQDVDNYEMLLHAENLLRADKKNLKTVHPNHELRCKHETKLL